MNKESVCGELKIQPGNYMSRGVKAVCALVLMALSCWLSPLVWAEQEPDAGANVQAELPENLKLMQDALQKRQSVQLPAGPLQDSNTAVVQVLTELVQGTIGLQSLLAAGPTANEASLIVDEWKKIKARMRDAGLTPQEQAGMATTNSPGNALPPAKNGSGASGRKAATPTPSKAATAAPALHQERGARSTE